MSTSDHPSPAAPAFSAGELELERALLAALLSDPARIAAVRQLVNAEDLADPLHQRLYEAMVEATPLDAPALEAQLAADPAIASVLQFMATAAPSAAGTLELARAVAEQGARRRVREFAGKLHRLAAKLEAVAVAPDLGPARLSDAAEALALEPPAVLRGQEPRTLESVLGDTLAMVGRLPHRDGPEDDLPEGVLALDRATRSFDPVTRFLLSAGPLPKDSLALKLALDTAVHAGQVRAVAVFTMELPSTQLVFQLLCREARIAPHRLRAGRLSAHDLQRMAERAAALWSAPIYLDDTRALTLESLRERTRWVVGCLARLRGPPLGLVVVDALELMHSTTRLASRELELEELSAGLASLSEELGVPVRALSQDERDAGRSP